MEITVENKDGLQAVADTLLSLLHKGYRVILLEGELGAGKTTLTQMLCRQIGVTEPVSSPTFSLVNEYTSPAFGTVYHMDLYRLEKEGDLVQIGLEEYLDSGQLCMIEWPAIAEKYFYQPAIRINIKVETNNIRIFNITTYDAVDA